MSGWYGFIGVPTDVGNKACGAAEGPAALRAIGLVPRMGMVDRGDVRGPTYDGARDDTGSRSVRETAAWCTGVRNAVAGVLADGGTPVMVGGDHAMALGSVAAAAEHARRRGRNFFVLWFDAHPDFNTPETSPSGNTHGYPAALACGIGHPALLRVGAFTPLLRPDRLIQFGIRDIDAGERDNLRRSGIEFHEMPAVRERGLAALVAHTINRIQAAGGGHVHVSFDIDALDPSVAPGVGTPVPDGLLLDECVDSLRLLGASGLVQSLDIVEYAATRDQGNRTAHLVEHLLAGFMAGTEGKAAMVA
ncbi:arginase [Niveispirillum sp.]|uniref:arginase n=1 Tax=Niveispirillum sp. TaxID=1917217 RepID=UPI001B643BB5|nr:arginase [Niveispirillum sp.]MBP7334435.1 arginase [Niveispirillum sp.]